MWAWLLAELPLSCDALVLTPTEHAKLLDVAEVVIRLLAQHATRDEKPQQAIRQRRVSGRQE